MDTCNWICPLLWVISNSYLYAPVLQTERSSMTQSPTYVRLNESIGKVSIETGFEVFAEQESGQEHSVYHCYIPTFDLSFTVRDRQEIEQRAKFLVNAFFHYWVTKEGLSAFHERLIEIGLTEQSNCTSPPIVKIFTSLSEPLIKTPLVLVSFSWTYNYSFVVPTRKSDADSSD